MCPNYNAHTLREYLIHIQSKALSVESYDITLSQYLTTPTVYWTCFIRVGLLFSLIPAEDINIWPTYNAYTLRLYFDA